MPTSARYRGWRFLPLRAVVWLLAVLYLGRIHYDNTLYDLRQLSVLEVAAKTAGIALAAGFAYWNLVLADPVLIGLVWGVALFFVAKVLFVLAVVRVGTVVAGRRDDAARRRTERVEE